MKKILLTSALAICMAAPAYATTVSGSGNECNEPILGTDTGPATLRATWDANTININWYSDNTKITPTNNTANTCTYDSVITLPTNTMNKTGYTFGGWQVRAAAQSVDLMTLIGNNAGASRAYINGSDNFTEDSASYGQSFYGITSGDTNAFAVNYGNNGIIHGHGACSTTPGTANWSEPYSFSTESSITDQTGTEGARYCWCHVDGYTPKDGTLQSVSSSWVFTYDDYVASYCASDCANACSNNLQRANSTGLAFRAAVFGVSQ